MEKLDPKTDGATVDIVDTNIENLKELFPDVFTEGKIDFDTLREVLGDYIDDRQERYSFTWNGKSLARRIAQTPSTGTLRPCPEESVNWDTTQNLFIEGDNLEVLKLMQKSYHKKVKMIYIDPPYNTGKDFIYPDNFRDNIKNYLELTGQTDEEGRKLSSNAETSGRYHTDWLNMMYPRLKLARNLLRDDGVIFISIDDTEVANLRKLCDEVFGEENFIDCIIWKKRYGGGAKEKYLVTVQEYILMYAKSEGDLDEIYIPLDDASIERYYTQRDNNYPIRGPYRTHPLEATKSMGERRNLVFPIIGPDGKEILPKRQWLWSTERVIEATAKDELAFIKDRDGQWTVHTKQYLKDENGIIRKGKSFSLIDDIYTQHGTNEIIDLFGNAQVFPFPKPSDLILRLLQIGLNDQKDAIVLDFFAGSCSTAHAALRLNISEEYQCKFIMIQLPEQCDETSDAFQEGFTTITDIGKERIRRVIKKIEAEQEQKANEEKGKLLSTNEDMPELDLGFKVFKLDSSNIIPWDADFDNLEHILFTSVENIKLERKKEDVLYELLLKYGLDLAVPIQERKIAGKTVYIIGAGALIVCLDDKITLDTVEGIAKLRDELKPEVMRVVFKDSGFKDDVVKTNTVQILRHAGIEDVRSL
ncbi:MAG: site-specific DNA-methyltransferase [bacterium]|nr:site-specific DNA-methyltransferase [bacterium]